MMRGNTIDNFIRKIKDLKLLLLVVLLAIFCVPQSVAADYSITAPEVGYTPADTSWDVDNVNDALEGLYLMTIEYKCLETLSATASPSGTMTDLLSPEFNPLITEYDLVMDTFDESFMLSGTLFDSYATVSGLNERYKVEYGKTRDINVVVTAVNGDIRVYTIHARREPFDTSTHTTYLSSIKIKGYDSSLDPEFTSLRQDYSLPILQSEVFLEVSAEAYDPHATIEISGDQLIFDDANVVTITVTEPNMPVETGVNPRVYEINWVKQAQNIVSAYDYTGHYEKFVAPKSGKYVVELWGAQGGLISGSSPGGGGAYTKGLLRLEADEEVYVFVGGSPRESGSTSGGWNGGGNSSSTNSGGGGATDIRLYVNPSDNHNVWNNFQSLKSRIMVAAGGGGGGNSLA